jgi:hypothetical protein
MMAIKLPLSAPPLVDGNDDDSIHSHAMHCEILTVQVLWFKMHGSICVIKNMMSGVKCITIIYYTIPLLLILAFKESIFKSGTIPPEEGTMSCSLFIHTDDIWFGGHMVRPNLTVTHTGT